MNNIEIQRLLSPFSFKEIFQEIGLQIKEIREIEKDDLLGKISGNVFFKNREYQIEFKKYHDLRYGNVLPSMLESHLSSYYAKDNKQEVPVLLIARVKKLSDSFLDNAIHFFNRYENKSFNWFMIDDQGRLVGQFEGQIIDKMVRLKSSNKIRHKKHESKHKLSFSPIQQWLLKYLLLNDVEKDLKEKFGSMLWPFESHKKIHDYKVLSKISDVSASSCFNFLKIMQTHEYLFIDEYKYYFRNLRKLFDLWEAQYLSARKEEIYLSPIRPMESIESWREKIFHLLRELNPNLKNKIVMSGHLACQKMDLAWSNNQSVIFHVADDSEMLEKLIKKLKLRPSESPKDGIRMILHKNDYPVLKVAEDHREVNIADPIHLMLDVLYLGGRGKEQADYIFEKILKRHFKRNEWMS